MDVNVTEDELAKLKALLLDRDAADGDAAKRYLIEAQIALRVPALLATVERLREAIWPGLPKWAPTEDEPQQDFHEALIESLRAGSELAEQYTDVVQGGKRLPNAELSQDAGFCAFVLGKLETERDRLREALTWAVGFIRCNLPKTSEQYPDMRNAEALVNGALGLHTGEFELVSARAELAEHERDQLRAALERVRTAVSAN